MWGISRSHKYLHIVYDHNTGIIKCESCGDIERYENISPPIILPINQFVEKHKNCERKNKCVR